MAVPTTYANPNQTLAAGGLEGAATNVITAVFWNRMAAMIHYLGGTGGYIGCRATLSGTHSINSAAVTPVTLNAESFDSDPNGAMHDNVTLNTRVVCRTAGVYLISGYLELAANATGVRQAALRLNGGTVIANDTRVATTGGDVTSFAIIGVYALVATDYVELTALQGSGGALNATAAALALVKL